MYFFSVWLLNKLRKCCCFVSGGQLLRSKKKALYVFDIILRPNMWLKKGVI